MDRRRLALLQALLAALLALLSLVVIFRSSDAADPNGRELDLANPGRAWELNRDHKGHLWISDYEAGEVWQLNPATEVYTKFENLTGASDARLDASGDLWWVDYDNFGFGRLNLATDIKTVWPLTGTGLATGLNFDPQGRVWLPDSVQNFLYRFDPRSDEFCRFELPQGSAGVYIESHGGYLWLADWKLPHIYRIDPENGAYERWFYARSSDPRGMAFDDSGHLWWGGFLTRDALFRFDPNSPIFVTYYTLPDETAQPVMVDAQHGFIWYSDFTGQFGSLDPRLASGQTVQTTHSDGTMAVACYQDWQPLLTGSTTKLSDSASWAAGAYTSTSGAPGWKAYHLPEDSDNWGPWGIRAGSDGVWVVDQERRKLVHLPSFRHFVPLIQR